MEEVKYLDEIMKSLGNCILDLRTKRQYTQAELAFRANIQRNYISDIEHGEKNISMRVFFSLASALDISGTELVDMVLQRTIPNRDYKVLNCVTLVGKISKEACPVAYNRTTIWRVTLLVEATEEDEKNTYIEVYVKNDIKKHLGNNFYNHLISMKGKIISNIFEYENIGKQGSQFILINKITILSR